MAKSNATTHDFPERFDFEGFTFLAQDAKTISCQLFGHEFSTVELLAEQICGMVELLESHCDFAKDNGAMTAVYVISERAKRIERVLYNARQRKAEAVCRSA